jgi:predicted Zn-dependent protease
MFKICKLKILSLGDKIEISINEKSYVMKKKRIAGLLAGVFMLLPIATLAQTAAQDELVKTLKAEIDRSMTHFKKSEIPVYLLSYRVDEVESYQIFTSFGTLVSSQPKKERLLTIQVRVGDKTMDNYRELRDDVSDYMSYGRTRAIRIPLDNNPKAITQALWEETEKEYRNAVLRYEKVKANVAVKVEVEDKSNDYSDYSAAQYYEKPLKMSDFTFNISEWESRLKKYSAILAENKDVLDGETTLTFKIIRKYFITSEGTSIVQNNTYCHLYLSVNGVAEDGMELPLSEVYFAHSPQGLPDDNTMVKDAEKVSKTLTAMKSAPIVSPYEGPAILSNDAAGVFFHEIFGHRVEGLRLKSESDGQTFKKKVGEAVLHKNISVVFDPTITTYKGIPLNGSFKYDDEGVKGEKVMVIDKGVLKNFLMTRSPIENFPKSNGHARAQEGYQPVSRQSNLIVETEKPYTDAELKKMLIDEAKKQGKEYGYFFAKVQGGFTTTGRFMPNSFNVLPLEVYRIYVDGRPDELVRGVDLVGTPLAMFSQVEAVGDTPGNFAGTCGAESGGVPAGCCSPALFVKQIEMQKKDKAQNRPPVLNRP